MSLERNLLNIEIKDIFNHLNFLNSKVNNILIVLKNSIDPNLYIDIVNKYINFNFQFSHKSEKLKKKFDILENKNNVNVLDVNFYKSQDNDNVANLSFNTNTQPNDDPWFKNFSDTVIPNAVIDVLRLGEKFSSSFLSSKQNIIFQIIKDVKSSISFIEGEEVRDRLGHRVLNSSKTFLNNTNNKKISHEDSMLGQKIVKTKQFLNKNKQLLVTHANKGNITVILNHKDYNSQMLEFLNNTNKYKKVGNPENLLKKNTSKIMDFWRKEGYLGDVIKRKVILCENTNLPRMYGLSKVHKINCPLLPVVSLINYPTFEMDKMFNNIFKKPLQIPLTQIKNSYNFKDMITSQSVPADHLMVSFDVTSLLTNVPFKLVNQSKGFSNRDITILSMSKTQKYLRY